jgi:hypothetical protein
MNSASRRISDTFGSPLVGRRTTSTGRGSAVSTSCTRHVPLIATSIDFKRFEHGEKQNSTVVSVSPTRKQRPSAQKQSSATSADVNRKRPSSVAIEDVFEIDSQKKIKTSKLPNRSVLAPASPSRDLNATDQIPLEEVAMTTSGLLRFVLPS